MCFLGRSVWAVRARMGFVAHVGAHVVIEMANVSRCVRANGAAMHLERRPSVGKGPGGRRTRAAFRRRCERWGGQPRSSYVPPWQRKLTRPWLARSQ